MIARIKHKGLRRLFERGDASGINPQYVEKVTLILTTLNAAETIEGMDLPSFRLHQLIGNFRGFWSVAVRANWRIIYRFEDGQASGVDFAVKMSPRRPGDSEQVVAKADRIRETLGWQPRLENLETIVTQALAWEKRLERIKTAG